MRNKHMLNANELPPLLLGIVTITCHMVVLTSDKIKVKGNKK